MRWRTTFGLAVIAALLFGFIWFVERHEKSTGDELAPKPLLAGLQPQRVLSVQIHRTNQFILQVRYTNEAWEYTAPFPYPAQPLPVRDLIEFASKLNKDVLVSDGRPDTKTVTNSAAAYGLEQPQALITFQQDPLRFELRLGARTPSGDKVYAQLVGNPGVYAVPGVLLDALPRSPHDWRETSLIQPERLQFNRISVSNSALGYTIVYNGTNNTFMLTKPFQARVDASKVDHLLTVLRDTRVSQFVSDSPQVDLDLLGLQPPEIELAIGLGTNDLVKVQFGKTSTNDTSMVFARRMTHTNIVLVPKAATEVLKLSHSDMRDPRVMTFNPASVTSVDVQGEDAFSLRRNDRNQWILEPKGITADDSAVAELLLELRKLPVLEFTRDFVKDFAPYGLATPQRRWTLKGSVTNALSATVTNTILASLEVGNAEAGRVYVRRSDEPSVYAVSVGNIDHLPYAAWQLRDRQVWSFKSNEVVRITLEQNGRSRQWVRNPDATWTSEGPTPNSFEIEEMSYRLGELRAAAWIQRGTAPLTRFGINAQSPKLTLDVRRATGVERLQVQFGERAPSHYPYAVVQIEGEPWVFEFPLKLHVEMAQAFGMNVPKL